jgi:tRNA 2-selenouridine synthase SelU
MKSDTIFNTILYMTILYTLYVFFVKVKVPVMDLHTGREFTEGNIRYYTNLLGMAEEENKRLGAENDKQRRVVTGLEENLETARVQNFAGVY